MRKADLQKHKFDGKMKLALFLGLILLAVALQISHSALEGEVVGAILVLAGVNKAAQ